jgi:hypothetical protein
MERKVTQESSSQSPVYQLCTEHVRALCSHIQVLVDVCVFLFLGSRPVAGAVCRTSAGGHASANGLARQENVTGCDGLHQPF